MSESAWFLVYILYLFSLFDNEAEQWVEASSSINTTHVRGKK